MYFFSSYCMRYMIISTLIVSQSVSWSEYFCLFSSIMSGKWTIIACTQAKCLHKQKMQELCKLLQRKIDSESQILQTLRKRTLQIGKQVSSVQLLEKFSYSHGIFWTAIGNFHLIISSIHFLLLVFFMGILWYVLRT